MAKYIAGVFLGQFLSSYFVNLMICVRRRVRATAQLLARDMRTVCEPAYFYIYFNDKEVILTTPDLAIV